MVDKMIQNLEEKTGKKMSEWISIVKSSGEEKHMAKVKFLKTEHGLTHGYANLIVHSAKEGGLPTTNSDTTALVSDQYAKKSNLKPIYDMLVKKLSAMGKDVEIAPKKTYVSIRRKKQFALIQPTTKTRVDIGINIKGKPVTDRLELSGSFNGMVSHRVRVTDKKEVDKELMSWLREAYELAS